MSWTTVGNLNIARILHSATLLANGKVLVYGGSSNNNYESTAELYDPRSKTFALTGSAFSGRVAHSAFLLNNGKVLVAAGSSPGDFAQLTSCELYDPETAEWQPTGRTEFIRQLQTGVVLLDGRVMLVGGDANNPSIGFTFASCEIYDPAQGGWARTGDLNIPRLRHTATVLMDGRVLVVGGETFSASEFPPAAELFDPTTGVWSLTSKPFFPRYGHTATRLNDKNGKVLVAGGGSGGSKGLFPALRSVELYDPQSGTWSSTGDLETGRAFHFATLLHDGRVLIQGGTDSSGTALASAEVYDPSNFGWTSAGSISVLRASNTMTLLKAGRFEPGAPAASQVLITGGQTTPPPGTILNSCELYDSGTHVVNHL